MAGIEIASIKTENIRNAALIADKNGNGNGYLENTELSCFIENVEKNPENETEINKIVKDITDEYQEFCKLLIT